MVRDETTFLPRFAPTPLKFFCSEPSDCRFWQIGVVWQEIFLKSLPKCWSGISPSCSHSSCFTRELAETLNNFLQVSWDSRCSLWINLLKIFSVGGWKNVSWKSTAGYTSPSRSPETTCPAPRGNTKKIRLSKMPASISLRARGFQQVLICGEWERWFLQNLHFQSCSHAPSVRNPVFSRFGQKVILISGKLLI